MSKTRKLKSYEVKKIRRQFYIDETELLKLKNIFFKALNDWERLYLYALKQKEKKIFEKAAENNQVGGICLYFIEQEIKENQRKFIFSLINKKLNKMYLCPHIFQITREKKINKKRKILSSIRMRINFLEEIINEIEQ